MTRLGKLWITLYCLGVLACVALGITWGIAKVLFVFKFIGWL